MQLTKSYFEKIRFAVEQTLKFTLYLMKTSKNEMENKNRKQNEPAKYRSKLKKK